MMSSRPATFMLLGAVGLMAAMARAQEGAPAAAPLADLSTPAAEPAAAPPPADTVSNAEPAPADVSTNGAPVETETTTNGASNPATAGLIVTTPAAARFESAMGSFNAGQFADAVRAFSDFVRDFPQDRRREEALYRLAESYRNLGRTEDALAAYTFQVQAYPEGPLRVNGELRRGAIFFGAGKYGEAAVPLGFVAEKGDGELQEAARYLLGRSFLATQKEAEGRALLQALADESPGGKFTGDSAQALAQLDDAEGRFPEALALWEKALALAVDPAVRATAAARGGWSALEAKQPSDAEKLFQTARQFDPDGNARKVANTGLLRIFFQQKRFTEWLAIYLVEKDKLLESASEEILYDLGHAEFSIRHWPDAVEAFDAYLAAFGTQAAAVTAAYERFLALTQMDRSKTPEEAESYLKAWPQSPYRARVELLEAQELSRQEKFAEALPLWVRLAAEPAQASWPQAQITLELARAYDEVGNFPKAATAYQAYLDDLAAHPGGDRKAEAQQVLQTEARLAVCLQKSDQSAAATNAWQAVESLAAEGSREEEMALESLGLIYAQGGLAQEKAMVETFRKLLARFPQSKLRGMAAFSVGDSMFKNRDYAGAEPFFLEARDWDAKTWLQPATQRLVLGAYGLKDEEKTVGYLKEYDTIPEAADAEAQNAARLPAALFYWLGETARKAGNEEEAELDYSRVTQHPDPGDLLAGAWWQLGEVQSGRKEWTAAAASYGKYRQLKPEAKDATVVVLALGRAELGAQNDEAARALGNQALLQEPEGPNSAAARMLLGEVSFATQNYAEAARMFATLAVLFDDPKITPQAISRAADAFEKAGNPAAAEEQREKLKDKYPEFEPAPYL